MGELVRIKTLKEVDLRSLCLLGAVVPPLPPPKPLADIANGSSHTSLLSLGLDFQHAPKLTSRQPPSRVENWLAAGISLPF